MIYITDPDASKIVEVLNLDPSGVRLTQAQVNYVHYLVSNLKATGMWQNSIAIYGFVGGTAYKHQWNWKDLRNLDAAYRLTYEGSQTHDANGVRNTTSSGNSLITNINQTSGFNANNFHFSFYTNLVSTTIADDMGLIITAGAEAYILAANNNNANLQRFIALPGNTLSTTQSIKTGFYTGSKINTNSSAILRSTFLTSTATLSASSGSNVNVRLGARSSPSNTIDAGQGSSTNRYCFASIGSGLTDTIATTSSHHITVAQSILNRA